MCTNNVHELLSLVDSKKEELGDGAYLELCNQISTIYDNLYKEITVSLLRPVIHLQYNELVGYEISIKIVEDKVDMMAPAKKVQDLLKSQYLDELDISSLNSEISISDNVIMMVPKIVKVEEFVPRTESNGPPVSSLLLLLSEH